MGSLVDELTKLAALREMGALNDEEFDQAKGILLRVSLSPSSLSLSLSLPLCLSHSLSRRRTSGSAPMMRRRRRSSTSQKMLGSDRSAPAPREAG
eukprot:COSAG03_NODE_6954_length_982_cov_9.657984_1_plen_95_part_00